MSKNFKQNQKHFQYIFIDFTGSTQEDWTFNGNLFGNIAFDNYNGKGINKISVNAFCKSTDSFTGFSCEKCRL